MLNHIKNVDTDFGNYNMHRINEIRGNTDTKQWNYIPSNFNVGDDAINVQMFPNCKVIIVVLGPDFYIRKVFPLISKGQNTRSMKKKKKNLHNTGHISESTNIKKNQIPCVAVS